MASKRKGSSPQMVVRAAVAAAVAASEADGEADAGAGEGAGEGGGAAGAGVGRLVDSSQADDRRVIALVRARPLLFARNNMPVASYYSRVKALWQEVAADMGWTVADVRRKWSHIRNSYSRHLRNEMYGVRTGRGRMVSKWYLADELDFLKEHMATDTRPNRSYSYSSVYMDIPTKKEKTSSVEPVDLQPFLQSPWFTAITGPTPAEPAGEPLVNLNESSNPSSFEPDENTAYFQFFRGIYNDYQELSAPRQRKFRRESLNILHRLLDEEDEHTGRLAEEQQGAMNLSHSAMEGDDDHKFGVIDRMHSEMILGGLPDQPPATLGDDGDHSGSDIV